MAAPKAAEHCTRNTQAPHSFNLKLSRTQKVAISARITRAPTKTARYAGVLERRPRAAEGPPLRRRRVGRERRRAVERALEPPREGALAFPARRRRAEERVGREAAAGDAGAGRGERRGAAREVRGRAARALPRVRRVAAEVPEPQRRRGSAPAPGCCATPTGRGWRCGTRSRRSRRTPCERRSRTACPPRPPRAASGHRGPHGCPRPRY